MAYSKHERIGAHITLSGDRHDTQAVLVPVVTLETVERDVGPERETEIATLYPDTLKALLG